MTNKVEDYTKLTFDSFKREFPELYKDVYCGFDCPDNYKEIVWNLSKDLANISDSIQCSQVKSKRGSLRYYVTFSCEVDEETSKRIYRVIHEAEAKTL